jgi:UTP--glucose-1-phosphate uridylyltransferase
MPKGFQQRTVRRAVIAAAGLGTRLSPLTRLMPKPLLPVVDRPLVDYAISDVKAANISEIFVLYDSPTVQRWREVQESYQLKDWDHVSFVPVQANDHHWGESLLEIEHQLENEPFALVLASELFEHGSAFLVEMITTYEETGCAIVAINDRESAEDLISLLGVEEAPRSEGTPDGNRDRLLGRYILPPSFMKTLKQTSAGNGKLNFFAALNQTAQEGKLLGIVCRNRHWVIRVPLDYLLATVDFGVDDFEYGPVLRQHLAVKLSHHKEKEAASERNRT